MAGNRADWLTAIFLVAFVASGQTHAAKPQPAASKVSSDKTVATTLTPAQTSKLAMLKAQHLKAKAALPDQQQIHLDAIAGIVGDRLFAALPSSDLPATATRLVRESVPALSDVEASAVGAYALDAIASGVQRDPETQLAFNLQYLQLQSQMRALSREYEALGRIMQSKHDMVENSISNVR
ncbi:MAG TPA: hypothetical protein VIV63_17130 [Steroidobacteraceae bacterium]